MPLVDKALFVGGLVIFLLHSLYWVHVVKGLCDMRLILSNFDQILSIFVETWSNLNKKCEIWSKF